MYFTIQCFVNIQCNTSSPLFFINIHQFINFQIKIIISQAIEDDYIKRLHTLTKLFHNIKEISIHLPAIKMAD